MAHQQEYYQAIRASTNKGECGPFIDFMLDKILRTLKAKGKAYEAAAAEKSSQKIMGIIKSMPDVTLTELANATGLSVSGAKKNIRKLKDATQGIVGIVLPRPVETHHRGHKIHNGIST